MSDGEWLMRVESGLSAHYIGSDGKSRPGVTWAIGLKRGDDVHTALVRAILADGASASTRADEDYQARTAMQYLNDRINAGWHPSQDEDHTIYLGDPPGAGEQPASVAVPVAPAATRPRWKFW